MEIEGRLELNTLNRIWRFFIHREFMGICAILGNPQIFSAMAMSMSIYRTLCVLVSSDDNCPHNLVLGVWFRAMDSTDKVEYLYLLYFVAASDTPRNRKDWSRWGAVRNADSTSLVGRHHQIILSLNLIPTNSHWAGMGGYFDEAYNRQQFVYYG